MDIEEICRGISKLCVAHKKTTLKTAGAVFVRKIGLSGCALASAGPSPSSRTPTRTPPKHKEIQSARDGTAPQFPALVHADISTWKQIVFRLLKGLTEEESRDLKWCPVLPNKERETQVSAVVRTDRQTSRRIKSSARDV